MFTHVLNENARLLTLSARDHALINGTIGAAIGVVFREGDWTCNTCGIRIEGLMEVDHLKAHKQVDAGEMAPICQFCHDLKHPIWAMSRKRAFPVYAPDLKQADLSRFSWTVLSEMTRPNAPDGFDALLDALGEREAAAFEMLDGENMEAALEALFVIRDRVGAGAAERVAGELDKHIRFLPSCIRDGSPVRRWTPAGFRPVPVDHLHLAFGPEPDFPGLSEAALELL